MNKPSKTIVVIGGVAGGASAAARLRRLDENAHIIMVERGEHVSFANCGLPYHIGGDIEDREDLLVQTAAGLHRRFNLDVRTLTEAVSIDRAAKTLRLKHLSSGQESVQAYDVLVLSPGAAPLKLPIPGADLPGVYTLRNLPDMDAIKAKVDSQPTGKALVLGGGYIGLEMAEALRHRGMDVLMVELGPQVMGPADPEMAAYLAMELREQGVVLRTGTSLKSLAAHGHSLTAELSDGTKHIVGMAVLAAGVRPETRLASEAGLALGPRGGIQVDQHMRTSDPSIYAVGDAVEVKDFISGRESLIPLAGPANRQGRIAADNICGLDSTYKGTQGTAIARVFTQVFGMTGASEKALKAAGKPYEKIYLHPGSHAGYFPGAKPLRMKLLFDPADGRVLGAQVVGQDGVDKRIDVLAVAVRAGLTVYDLQELELAYAPPFGSAKDPINFAGFVAVNALEGLSGIFHQQEAAHPSPDQFLLDVRTAREFKAGSIAGAMNIPVDSLRERLAELPQGKEILVFCQVGIRGHAATRILTQAGFKARNLSGGYLTWQAFEAAAA